MTGSRRPLIVRLLSAGLVCIAAASAAAQVAAEPLGRLRVVGGLGAATRYSRLEEPFWTAQLSKLSGGRFSAEIVPFDRAGVPGQDMLRLIQLGVVQFGTALFSNIAAQDPEISAPDLAGLNPDMTSLRRNVAAFRPYFEQTLRERYGIEVLALYVYPAQVLFCKQPLDGLRDIVGRRVRVSGPSAADFIEALGAIPVVTAFNEVIPNMKTGNTDCAVTGTMSGNAIGLHEVTEYIHPMAITWGLAMFGTNSATWNALPADLKTLLRRELPRLEAAIWTDAEQETSMGMACNTGTETCHGGRRGKMQGVPQTQDDERRRKEIFAAHVLPLWVQRCGPSCAQLWNRTLAPATGIRASSR
jgi:TRAP-type C4-dicarboxylate transport system substrate-binding protein